MSDLIFTINTVSPVFLIILLGVFLRKIKIINENFITISSKLVFNVALPTLIFIKISQTNFNEIAKGDEILFGCTGVLICFFISMVIGYIFIKDRNKNGVFIQGAFRGNYAIIGLAILFNIYGEPGIAKGAMLLSFALPFFNVLAIIALTISMHKFSKESSKLIFYKIITNPNIIAVAIALLFSYFQIPLHEVILKTGTNIANMTLPLALIGIGGSLSYKNLKENILLLSTAAIMKIIVFPVIFTIIAYIIGFRTQSLVALYLLFAVPTAVTSFIFAKELGGDERLAANIVFLTTLSSIITISIGVYILKVNGMIF